MNLPAEVVQRLKKCIRGQWKLAFLSAFICGLLVHMPMLLSDIPNHDGLDSMHFNQNMITSGRWFLMVACGFSSYYTLPWLIGLLSILWLAVAATLLIEFLEVKDSCCIVLISCLLVTFPSIASTFTYAFTMDGYMLSLLLAVASVLCVKKYRNGFWLGAVCLAFSLGIYQSYLPVAAILSIYGILMLAMDRSAGGIRQKWTRALRYVYMGVLGLVLYYGILQVLLKVQGKELNTYQGINSLDGLFAEGLQSGIQMVGSMYRDFFAFSLKGNVIINNGLSLTAVLILLLSALVVLCRLAVKGGWWKSAWFYGLSVLLAVGIPISANLILVISSDVTYHLLMRYQWVLFLILPLAFVSRYTTGKDPDVTETEAVSEPLLKRDVSRWNVWATWGVVIAGALLVWNFAVTDHIGYSNLQKKYEKTYAYCVRLLDRIEQTEGYYQGIPVAMIGVVGDESYPTTDITQNVTSNLIGMNGDVLLYTGNNYELFIKHYLGATLNILPAEAMGEIYYSQEYREMESFPGESSVKLVDGIIYVKTENIDKTPDEEGR